MADILNPERTQGDAEACLKPENIAEWKNEVSQMLQKCLDEIRAIEDGLRSLSGPSSAPEASSFPETAFPETASPETAFPETAFPETASPETASPEPQRLPRREAPPPSDGNTGEQERHEPSGNEQHRPWADSFRHADRPATERGPDPSSGLVAASNDSQQSSPSDASSPSADEGDFDARLANLKRRLAEKLTNVDSPGSQNRDAD